MFNTIKNQIEVSMATMVHRACEFQEALTAYEFETSKTAFDDEKADGYFNIAFNRANWSITLAQDLGLNPNMVCKKCIDFMEDYRDKRIQMGLICNG
jgi:hypothetical protein